MTRDMSHAQFKAALKRHGLTLELLWIHRNVASGLSGVGIMYDGRTKRPLYRQSLAYALRRFREDDEERARKAH